ncbi:MAG TPA: glucose-6-phosphate dehydrogenase [Gemmatimonadaceae bacterium]|nr:glucose-6-phosphate dehydrogenase [Gemmatimonadaceae bacterium]
MRHCAVSPAATRATADSATFVLVGALGDLARRKLYPALYGLACDGLLGRRFTIVGIGRESHTDASFVAAATEALTADGAGGHVDASVARTLFAGARYVRGDLMDPATYVALGEALRAVERDVDVHQRNRLFYLAIPPSLFLRTVEQLSESGLAPRTRTVEAMNTDGWARLVIEKPFGRDLSSARALNIALLSRFAEPQLYRIDHYLGKETVQNLLAFRFANSIFEPLWNRGAIAHVEITAAETVGVEGRGGYYEEAGVLRDMFQSHLIQLLALTAMEAPAAMDADAVRDEKVKVLRAVRRVGPADVARDVVLAQYEAGRLGEAAVPAYRGELSVGHESRTPTYAAVRFAIDDWRWEGVPFYVRSGKRLAARTSEIVVGFRRPPSYLWPPETRATMVPNELVIRLQPDEGIALRFQAKRPGAALALTPELELAPVRMRFTYQDAFGGEPSPAYETLLLDAMIGDATLFARSDEVEEAWAIVDTLTSAADRGKLPLERYAAGSAGPAAADALLVDGAHWSPLFANGAG